MIPTYSTLIGFKGWKDSMGFRGDATTIAAGTVGGPRDVCISPDSSTAYITDYSTGNLFKIDAHTGTVLGSVKVALCTTVVMDNAGVYLYAANITNRVVTKIRASDMSIIGSTVALTASTIGSNMHMCFDPTESYLYVALGVATLGAIVKINTTTLGFATVASSISVGGGLREIVHHPTLPYIYVAKGASSSGILRMHTVTLTVDASWYAPSNGFYGLTINRAGTELLGCRTAVNDTNLHRIDIANASGIVVPLDATYDAGYGVAYSPDESIALCCCLASGQLISRINLNNNRTSLISGTQQSRAVKFAPNGQFALAIYNVPGGAVYRITKTP